VLLHTHALYDPAKAPSPIARSKIFTLIYSAIALILILHCISDTIHSSLTLFNSLHSQFTRQYSITCVLKSLQIHQPSSVESPPRQHCQDWGTGTQPQYVNRQQHDTHQPLGTKRHHTTTIVNISLKLKQLQLRNTTSSHIKPWHRLLSKRTTGKPPHLNNSKITIQKNKISEKFIENFHCFLLRCKISVYGLLLLTNRVKLRSNQQLQHYPSSQHASSNITTGKFSHLQKSKTLKK
jgi:hypothetical protein